MKSARIALHPLAVDEINQLYDYVAAHAGHRTASRYIARLYAFIEALSIFPQRGTVRGGSIDGLRIVGFERRASIAFRVEDDTVTILGVFSAGKDVTDKVLQNRR